MIPHNLPTLGIEEKCAASKVIMSGWVAQGQEVESFENELCNYFDLPEGHALAVSSGSSALYLSLLVLNAENKNIGLPVYACAALRNAIGMVNGNPIYFDCKEGSPNIDISSINKKDIDILIAASIYGIPIKIPTENNFMIIEDIAQSMGAVTCGKKIGLRGDIGICSFYATKMITSGGQGGAVISKNKELIDKLRDYRAFDCRDDKLLRFNFQMTDLQASVGRVQLKKLPDFLKKRNKIFRHYMSLGLNLFDVEESSDLSAKYRAVIKSREPQKLIEELASNNIKSIVPIEQWELLDDPKYYPNALKLSNETVSLPIYPNLNVNNVKIISNIAKKYS